MAPTRYWVPEVFLEPLEQAIQRRMQSASVAEPIRGYTDILHPGLDTGEIPKEKLPRELLGRAQKVRDSLRGFSFLCVKALFQFRFIAVHCSVVLVIENFSSK